MFQLFAYGNPLHYAFLLLLTVVLRLPSFHSNFITTDEAELMVLARQLADGAHLYQEAWTLKPPLLVWLYAGFVQLFGDAALTVIRGAACLWIYLTALLFNQLTAEFKQSANVSLAPGFLYSAIACFAWSHQEFGPDLFITLPALWTISLFIRHFIDEQPKWNNLFFIGMLCGLMICVKYQAVVHLLAMLLLYAVTARPVLRDLMTMAGGLILVIVLVLLPIYFGNYIPAYWDIGLAPIPDYFRFGNPEGAYWPEVGAYFGAFAVIALIGFIGIRQRYYKLVIRQRRVEALISIWLLFALVQTTVGGLRFDLNHLQPLLPPLVFYITMYLDALNWRSLRRLAVVAAFAFPAFGYFVYWTALDEHRYAWLRDAAEPDGVIERLYHRVNLTPQEHLIVQDFAGRKVAGGILVTDFMPTLYLRLNQPCASRYATFDVARFKMDWLTQNIKHQALASRPETKGDVYRTLSREMPAYIIDPSGAFRDIRAYMPLLLQDYREKRVGRFNVYYLERPRV